MRLLTGLIVRSVGAALTFSLIAAAAGQPTPPAPGGVFDPSKPSTAEPDTSVMARVRADPRLTQFLSLIEVTRQESLLRTENATVFAPTNDAFAKVPPAELERLASPGAADELRSLVRGHVLFKVVPSNQLGAERRLRSISGRRLLVERDQAGAVTVAGARLVQADVTASNGVLHLVDAVLIPPASNLLTMIENDPRLSIFTKLVKSSGRDVTLASNQNFTVFAPTNAAFERLSPGVIDGLLDPDNLNDLRLVVSRHIVSGVMYVESLDAFATAERGLPALSGEPLKIEVMGGGTLINKTARIESGDAEAKNGVLHITTDMLRFIPWGEEAKPPPPQEVPGETAPASPSPTPPAPPAPPAAPATPR